MQYIHRAVLDKYAAIIDVGGGELTLVDDLIAACYGQLTVLDISATALETTQHRLGRTDAAVSRIAADALSADLPAAAFDVWRDRAVFLFLTSHEQRQRYVAQALRALKPGGFAIVGTFGRQGPHKCSGLPVARCSAYELHDTVGEPFQLLDSSFERHTTPWCTRQQCVCCFCRRVVSQPQTG